MKFIHTADLHLDSKMETHLSPEKAGQRRREILDTFSRLVEFAEQEDVRAILISGDLFDKTHIRKVAKRRVWDEIIAHPDIDFLYLRGNHDQSDFLDGEVLPDNLVLFSEEEWKKKTYGNICIYGRELTEANAKTITTNLVPNRINTNLVMLHGQESEYEGEDRTEIVNLAQLRDKYIDYLALGHIHRYKCQRLDDRGVYCYPGALEGRGFDECGEKGFVLLEIEEGKVQHRFIPFASRRIWVVPVETDVQDTTTDIIVKVGEAVAGTPEKDLCRVELQGWRQMESEIDTRRIERSFSQRFFYFEVRDKTRIQIDYENFVNDHSLKGAFIRLLRDEEMPEEEREKIIEIGMKAIMGEEIEE